MILTTNLYSQKDMSVDLIGSFDNTGVTNSTVNISPFTSDYFSDHWKENIYTYRVGANFSFRIYKDIMIKTGLRFCNLGEVIRVKNIMWRSEVGPDGFELDSSLPRYFNIKTAHRYIEIPLLVRYNLGGHGRTNFFIETGISQHIYVNTKITTKSNLETVVNKENISEETTGFNNIQTAIIISIGLNYDFSDQFSLFGQPTFRYHRSGIRLNPNASISRHYAIGLELGIRKYFGSYFSKLKS